MSATSRAKWKYFFFSNLFIHKDNIVKFFCTYYNITHRVRFPGQAKKVLLGFSIRSLLVVARSLEVGGVTPPVPRKARKAVDPGWHSQIFDSRYG